MSAHYWAAMLRGWGMRWPLGWMLSAVGDTTAHDAASAALRDAVDAGNLVAAKAALADGADVNSEQLWPEGRGNGETAVHIAAASGHADVMACLLAVPGVDVNGLASETWTPLCLASHAGHYSVVRQLLDCPGIDVNAQCTGGLTALHLATINGSVEVVQQLLAAPAISCDIRTGGGETALHLAVLNDRTPIVQAILADGGCDVNARTADQGGGHTALRFAALNNRVDLVRALLSDPRTDVNTVCGGGQTALHSAARSGSTAVVGMLLRQPCANPRLADNAGRTPYDTACATDQQRQQHGPEAAYDTNLHTATDVRTLFDSWEQWEVRQRAVLSCLKRLAVATSFLGLAPVPDNVADAELDRAVASLPRRCDGGGDVHDMIVHWYIQSCRRYAGDGNVSTSAELQQWLRTSAAATHATSSHLPLTRMSSCIVVQPSLWAPPMV